MKLYVARTIAWSTTMFLPAAIMAASDQCDGAHAAGGVCNASDLQDKINLIINALFLVAGSIAVIIIIMGGLYYINSTGDKERITRGKNTILYAVIGLIVVILARLIVGFVVGKIA